MKRGEGKEEKEDEEEGALSRHLDQYTPATPQRKDHSLDAFVGYVAFPAVTTPLSANQLSHSLSLSQ